jgi:SAM-dependent methyltransferase
MSAAELALARTRLGTQADLKQGRAQALPYPDGVFDCVLCHMALMLMDELDEVMRELRRVLRPGGRFAAVVGAMPPDSPVLSAYLEALSRRSRLPQFAGLRLGDRRLRSPEGIREVFASGFDELVIEELHLPLRLAPAQLRDWFLDLYDLQLLSAADRELVEHELMQAVTGATGPDGMLDFPQALRFLSARVD